MDSNITKSDQTNALKAVNQLCEGFKTWGEIAEDFEIGLDILKARELDPIDLSKEEMKLIEELISNRETLKKAQRQINEYQRSTKVTMGSPQEILRNIYDEVMGLFEMQNKQFLNTEKVTPVHRLVDLRHEQSLGYDRPHCCREVAQKRVRTGRKK